MMDQPDQGDAEKQQIPSLWFLLIIGIKEKKKNFPPSTLALVTAAGCHLQSFVTLWGWNLCCPPHSVAGCNTGLGLMQFCSQQALIGFSTSRFVQFRSLYHNCSDWKQ